MYRGLLGPIGVRTWAEEASAEKLASTSAPLSKSSWSSWFGFVAAIIDVVIELNCPS